MIADRGSMESTADVAMEPSSHVQGQTDPLPSRPTQTGTSSYAFLNHSSTTLPNNLPPSVDDKPLARQKRKRTSPEDQAVLEAAYNRDSKPDKTARLQLVRRVALSEKEVQIWFQNRRQTSRRKSRPLLPHEIVQYQLARNGLPSHLPPLDLSAELTSDGDVVAAAPSSKRPSLGPLDSGSHTSNIAERGGLEVDSSSPPSLSPDRFTEGSVAWSGSGSQIGASRDHGSTPADSHELVGSLANRRSASSLSAHASMESNVLPWTRHTQMPHQKHPSSLVRLSLTGDGNAEVVTKDGLSPSPPRASQSSSIEHFGKGAAPPGEPEVVPSYPEPRPLQRSSSARSRDSRTWHFWCDKEARTELENKAEKDGSGSAADAIDLLRSTSGRRVLGALSSRTSNMPPQHNSYFQRKRLNAKAPGLQKSSTALGRLQTNSKGIEHGLTSTKFVHKGDGFAASLHIPGNDSDKENWSPRSLEHSESSADDHPASDGSVRSRDEWARAEAIKHVGLQRYSSALGGSNVKREDNPPEEDSEIAAFMRGAKRTTSFSEAQDLDCIRGLLSLSQGNWR